MRKLFLLALCLSTTSCIWQKIAFNNADWLAKRQLDKYFDLTAKQEDYFEPRIEKLIARIKKEDLPSFLGLVEVFDQKLKDGFQKNDLVWLDSTMETLRLHLFDKYGKEAIEFLLTLDARQLKHYDDYLTEKSEDKIALLEKPTKEKLDDRWEESIESFESWYGELSSNQIKQLATFMRQNELDWMKKRHIARVNARQNFLTFMKSKPNATQLAQVLRMWLADPATMRTGVAKTYYQESRKGWHDQAIKVQSIVGMKGVNHFRKKVREIYADLKSVCNCHSVLPKGYPTNVISPASH